MFFLCRINTVWPVFFEIWEVEILSDLEFFRGPVRPVRGTVFEKSQKIEKKHLEFEKLIGRSTFCVLSNDTGGGGAGAPRGGQEGGQSRHSASSGRKCSIFGGRKGV